MQSTQFDDQQYLCISPINKKVAYKIGSISNFEHLNAIITDYCKAEA
ncbi:unnamed protein product (macronuclear) [Paramecium tetraurelia]|uniref:Uncharacterized protein n=1 Tax=Paramecium tetraurelia TaxID=5888 RepID=A0E010_PARTE|nr:uncharacterized protein GSPATT00021795001 [Paramecium tetraurelia]CAK88627.1 unnamed protein product [Paramecium tetraurelia]|eukprot:XP_001456024.1 hypothetical protein (macronuclear) [Paramecium tetraurelia strain d4-2]